MEEIKEIKNNVICRKATPEDISRVLEIEQKIFPIAEAAKESKLKWRQSTFGDFFFVAEKDGKVVSYISMRPVQLDVVTDTIYENAFMPKGDRVAILTFGTDPAYRGEGNGKKLLQYAIEEAKGKDFSKVILSCKDRYLPYYEKLGFGRDGFAGSRLGGKAWHNMFLPLKEQPQVQVMPQSQAMNFANQPQAMPQPQPIMQNPYPNPPMQFQTHVLKSKVVAGLLGMFIGAFGAHNLYLKYTVKGVIQLVLGIVGIFLIFSPLIFLNFQNHYSEGSILSAAIFGTILLGLVALWGFVESILILAGAIGKDGDGMPLQD